MKPAALRHAWLWEQFENRADYMRKPMFGCQAVYLYGRLMFCVTARGEPWSGILCATGKEHHASIRAEFPFLEPHPVLPKWLYLSDADEGFEYKAESLLTPIGSGDARFGVVPKERRRSGKRKAARRSKK